MQQHRQLSGRGNDGSLLPALPTTLGQLQPPASQITVHTKRSQNVLRSLYQQGSQIGVAFLTDVHLRLALSGVSSSGLQSQVAAHVAVFAKTMRILQRQQERQRDQRAHSLHLLQREIACLRQLSASKCLDGPVCSLELLQYGPIQTQSPSRQVGPHLRSTNCASLALTQTLMPHYSAEHSVQ